MIASLAAAFTLNALRTQSIADLVTPLGSATTFTQAEKNAMKKAIGSSRMVMLGEQTHGDGTSFLIKNEMVKFLHEEMGFNILAWESGTFDCRVMNDELKGTTPIRVVARLGLFHHWSQAEETMPILEYARASHKTKNPLQITGFDIQASGEGSRNIFVDFLKWFDGDKLLSSADRDVLEKLVTESEEVFKNGDDRAIGEIEVRNFKSSALLLNAAKENSDLAKKTWGKEHDFRMRCLLNAVHYGDMLDAYYKYLAKEDFFANGFNMRERANANNLLWMANTAHKGEKIIVWAHNMHIFKGYPEHGADTGQAVTPTVVDSMGRIVAKAMGKDLYSIGVAASGGYWSWLGGEPREFVPSEEGSLESEIAQLGVNFAFVDLRGATKIPGHPLNKPLKMRPDRQKLKIPLEMSWPQGFDGLLYIREMKPRTHIK